MYSASSSRLKKSQLLSFDDRHFDSVLHFLFSYVLLLFLGRSVFDLDPLKMTQSDGFADGSLLFAVGRIVRVVLGRTHALITFKVSFLETNLDVQGIEVRSQCGGLAVLLAFLLSHLNILG